MTSTGSLKKEVELEFHFFVCHTPFQRLLAQQYCRLQLDSHAKYFIFYEDAKCNSPQHYEDALVLPGYDGFFSAKGKAEFNVDLISHTILEKSTAGKYYVYLSDLRWTTNNYLYFRTNIASPNNTIMFVDGLGSYLDRKDPIKTLGYSCAKQLFSVLTGAKFRYSPFTGNYFGYDKCRALKVIGPRAQLIQGTLEKEDFSIVNLTPIEKFEAGKEKLLFLGQPLVNRCCSETTAEKIALKAISKISNLGQFEKYYKPHHFESNTIKELFYQRGFTPIETESCVEELIAHESYQNIVSYFSSGLAFSKLILGTQVKCYSVCFEDVAPLVFRKKEQYELNSLLRDFDIAFL